MTGSPKDHDDVVWTEEMDRLIGKVPDREIAERFELSMRSVLLRRRSLQIESPVVHRTAAPQWTPESDQLVGTMPDSELAERLRTTRYHARARRIALGIPPYVAPPLPDSQQPRSAKLVVTAAQRHKLGKVADGVLAERWGCSSGMVTRVRRSLGIKPFQESKEIEWTKGMLDLLGEVPDGKLAREYGISHCCVKIKRIQLGIFPYGKQWMDPDPDLPGHVISLIGKMPDKQISDQFKVHRRKIRIYRALHQIPEVEYSLPTLHQWTAEDENLLGRMSDGNVARRLQITPEQVHHRRTVLGIAPFDRQSPVDWSAEQMDQLGKEPDHQLARRWGYPQKVVRAKRESLGIERCANNVRLWTQAELAQLGTMPDTVLARKIGLSQTAVAEKRRGLKIAPFKAAGPYNWNEKDLERLGKMPDHELALELGLSYKFVARKRVSLGIPPFSRSR